MLRSLTTKEVSFLDMHDQSQDAAWPADSNYEWPSRGLNRWSDSLRPVVLALFCSDILQPVNIAAIRDANIGKEKFQRNVRQLVESFRRDLIAEAKDLTGRRAARIWEKESSPRAGVSILMAQTEQSSRSGPSNASATTSWEYVALRRQIAEIHTMNVGVLEKEDMFQLESKAFERYKADLLDLVHRPFRECIHEALGFLVLDENGDMLDRECRSLVAAEISWVPCQLFNLCEHNHHADRLKAEREKWTKLVWPHLLTWFHLRTRLPTLFLAKLFVGILRKMILAILKIWQNNLVTRLRQFFGYCESILVAKNFKRCIEQWTGETWDWWPLSPRTIPLETGFCRLEWQTPQGTARHVYFRENRRPLVTKAFETAPDFVNLEEPFAPCERCSSGEVRNTTSNVHDATSADSTSTQASSPETTSVSRHMTEHQQILEDLKGIHGLDVQLPLKETTTTEHLYLCVAVKDSFKACQIRTDIMRYDIDFFRELKTRYCEARGPWLRWLSPYRYHHCEFYELEKYGIDLIAPIDTGFPDEDLSYKFEPRPTKPKMPKGPISQKAFHDRFYKDKDFHFTWRGRQRCRYFYEPDSTSLRAVPKKLEPLELSDGKQEHFYGLYAVERLAFVRVLAYFALTLSLGIVVFFVMFSPETRQTSNAAFLIMMIMAALGFLRNYVHDDLYSVKQ